MALNSNQAGTTSSFPQAVAIGTPTRERVKVQRPPEVIAAAYALKVDDAAPLMGISPRTLWNIVHDGQIGVVTIGTRILIPRPEIEKFFAARTVHQPNVMVARQRKSKRGGA